MDTYNYILKKKICDLENCAFTENSDLENDAIMYNITVNILNY